MKPLVKYVGGKTKLAPELGLLIPEFTGTYHEPFCGGAALFAYLYGQKRIGKAVLSDLNKELMDLYKEVQNDPDDLILHLEEWASLYAGATAAEAEALFYRVRDDWNHGIRSASRYVFLKQTAFNGLWRVNKSGKINMPWGKYGHHGNRAPKILNADNIRQWNKALQNVELHCRSALDLTAAKGDVVYFDPPYAGTFDSYMAGGFSEDDLSKLLQLANDITRRGVFVVMSNSVHARVAAAKFWPASKHKDVVTTYAINRDASGRTNQTEVAFWSLIRKITQRQLVLFSSPNQQQGLFNAHDR